MKGLRILFVCGFTLALALSAQAYNGDVENGKSLFNDPALSGSPNAKSCSSCHPEGDLEGAGKRADLKKVINMCLTRPLAGKALKNDSKEMLDLESYIKSQSK